MSQPRTRIAPPVTRRDGSCKNRRLQRLRNPKLAERGEDDVEGWAAVTPLTLRREGFTSDVRHEEACSPRINVECNELAHFQFFAARLLHVEYGIIVPGYPVLMQVAEIGRGANSAREPR